MQIEEEVRFLLLALQREGNRLLAQALSPGQITPSQAEVISLLARYGSLSLKGLGELLVCETGESPSRLVERLVGRGLVERKKSLADGRAVTLSLTAAGTQLYGALVAPVEAGLHAQIGSAMTSVELEQLRDLLARFASKTGADAAIERRRSIKRPSSS